MEKILSIIIPTYNMEKYLRKCLDSLIVSDENMELLEVLVINDGSKDSSSEIAHEYENEYPDTFRVIDKENGNYGSCINRGIREAVGKYVKVLDADDYFDPDAFSSLLKTLQSYDVDLIVSEFQQVFVDGSIKPHVHNFPPNQILKFKDYFLANDFRFLQMHAVTYKLKNIKDIGYVQTEGISYTDTQWTFLPMISVDSFIYIPNIVYNYLLGREGQTMDKEIVKKQINQQMQMTLDRISMYEKNNIIDNYCEAYFWGRLYISLKYIYSFYLLDNMSLDSLITFDDEFKKRSRYLYSKANSIAIFEKIPFKFIKYWRNHSRQEFPACLKYIFKVLRKYQKA